MKDNIIITRLPIPQRDFLQYKLLFFFIALIIFLVIDEFVLEDSFFATNEYIYKKYYFKCFDNNFLHLRKTHEFFSGKTFTIPDTYNRNTIILAAQNQFYLDAHEFLLLELENLQNKQEMLNNFELLIQGRSDAIDAIIDTLILFPAITKFIDLILDYPIVISSLDPFSQKFLLITKLCKVDFHIVYAFYEAPEEFINVFIKSTKIASTKLQINPELNGLSNKKFIELTRSDISQLKLKILNDIELISQR